MDELVEYRARHAARYNERVAEAKKEEQYCSEYIQLLHMTMGLVSSAQGAEQLVQRLQDVNAVLHTHPEVWMVHEQEIRTQVMNMLEAINRNPTVIIQVHNDQHITQSRTIQTVMKEIMCTVGILHAMDEDLDLEYVMDCDGDETLARCLAAEEERPNILALPRRRARRQRELHQDVASSSQGVDHDEEELPKPIKKKVIKKKSIR